MQPSKNMNRAESLRFPRALRCVWFGLLLSLVGVSSVAAADVVYIDVRSWAEYQIDHIEGDTRIPLSDIADDVPLAFPDKQTPIRLYCARGGRAEQAKSLLTAAGYVNVENLGGIDNARRARGITE